MTASVTLRHRCKLRRSPINSAIPTARIFGHHRRHIGSIKVDSCHSTQWRLDIHQTAVSAMEGLINDDDALVGCSLMMPRSQPTNVSIWQMIPARYRDQRHRIQEARCDNGLYRVTKRALGLTTRSYASAQPRPAFSTTFFLGGLAIQPCSRSWRSIVRI